MSQRWFASSPKHGKSLAGFIWNPSLTTEPTQFRWKIQLSHNVFWHVAPGLLWVTASASIIGHENVAWKIFHYISYPFGSKFMDFLCVTWLWRMQRSLEQLLAVSKPPKTLEAPMVGEVSSESGFRLTPVNRLSQASGTSGPVNTEWGQKLGMKDCLTTAITVVILATRQGPAPRLLFHHQTVLEKRWLLR